MRRGDQPTPREIFEARAGILPVFAMAHLKGDSPEDRFHRAVREIDIFCQAEIPAVMVENYFGAPDDVERVLAHLQNAALPIRYGVNVLDDDRHGFELARRYDADFIQLDSVAGHLTPDQDGAFGDWLHEQRAHTRALVLGGVRFKYQPYLSGRPLREDLAIAQTRCDAVVVTGPATGVETAPASISEFRDILGSDFPLIVGAGVTAENCAAQMQRADGAIIGSSLKDTRRDDGDVTVANCAEISGLFRQMRGTFASRRVSYL